MLLLDELALVQKPLRCSVLILPALGDNNERKKDYLPLAQLPVLGAALRSS